MMMPRSFGRSDFWIFAIPFFVLIVVPGLSWFVVYITQSADGICCDAMWYLAIVPLFWSAIPGRLFGRPLFEPQDITYSPNGIFGYLTLFVFYVALWLIISFTLRAIIGHDPRRHPI